MCSPVKSFLPALVSVLLCACNRLPASGDFVVPPHPIERVPFTLADGLILVDGDANGQHGVWLLDTGAPYLVINTTQVILNEFSGPSTTVTDAYKQTSEQRLTKLSAVRWGPLTLRNVGAVAMNLHALEAIIHETAPNELRDQPLLGIVGIAQLEPFLTVFDYPAKQLTLVALDNAGTPRAAFPGPSPSTRVPIVMVAGTPFVHAILQEESVSLDALLAIDTGSDGGVVLDAVRVDRLHVSMHDRIGDTLFRSAGVHGDTIAIKRGTLDAVFVGNAMYDTVRITTRPDTGATLGFRVLRMRPMALNIRTRTLSLWEPR